MPIIFICALVFVPLIYLVYFVCWVKYQLKVRPKSEEAMSYIELLRRGENNCDKEKTSSVCRFSSQKYGKWKKCVYKIEVRKLDFNSEENLLKEVCVICTDSFTNGSQVVVLRCRNNYHVKCFRDWVVDKDTSPCPLCQQQVHIKTVVKWRIT